MMQEKFFSQAIFINGIIISLEGMMQNVLARVRNPALRQGLIFGIILGIILLAFSFIGSALASLSTYIVLALYLVLAFLAGQRASQETGKLTTGVLAGMLTCVIGALLDSLIYATIAFVNFDAYLQSYKDIAKKQGQNPDLITPSFLRVEILISILIPVILAVLLGLVGGALGANFGRRRAKLPPIEEYQEAMFEPSTSTPQDELPLTAPEGPPSINKTVESTSETASEESSATTPQAE
ncbi:MAG TPA: hypothetical protein VF844_10305 [Ktedonobacteraceae bacterium]